MGAARSREVRGQVGRVGQPRLLPLDTTDYVSTEHYRHGSAAAAVHPTPLPMVTAQCRPGWLWRADTPHPTAWPVLGLWRHQQPDPGDTARIPGHCCDVMAGAFPLRRYGRACVGPRPPAAHCGPPTYLSGPEGKINGRPRCACSVVGCGLST